MAKNTASTLVSTSTTKEETRVNMLMVDPFALFVVGVDAHPDGKVDGPEHPLYDERIKLPLDPVLVANIKHFGVIKPVLYRKDGDEKLIIDGRRRTLHARAAYLEQRAEGLETVMVPSIAKRGDNKMLFGLSRASNAMAVNDDPLLNAKNSQRFLDMGAPIEEVALTFGVKLGTVQDWLKLLDLAPEVAAKVSAKEITANAGLELAKVSMAEQIKVIAKATEAAGGLAPTTNHITEAVRDARGQAPALTPKVRVAKAVEKLQALAKSVVSDPKNALSPDEMLKAIKGVCVALTDKRWDNYVKAIATQVDKESAPSE